MPSKSSIENYTFKRGDSFKRDFKLTTVENDIEVPIDITGWTIESQLRYGNRLISHIGVEITDPQEGEFNIFIDYSDSENLKARKYECDIEFYMLNNDKVSSDTFTITVTKDVTFNA